MGRLTGVLRCEALLVGVGSARERHAVVERAGGRERGIGVEGKLPFPTEIEPRTERVSGDHRAGDHRKQDDGK